MATVMSGMSRSPIALLAIAFAATAALSACDPSGDEPSSERAAAVPDATLHTHLVEPSTPTPEGLAYLRSIASVHADADEREGEDRIRTLRRGLSMPVPAGLPEAEVMRLDLAARLGETLLADEAGRGARAARNLLQPMLTTERSLPLDRATARALVVLGDAAVQTGDDALAAGSYARSIEMMSLMRQELEQ